MRPLRDTVHLFEMRKRPPRHDLSTPLKWVPSFHHYFITEEFSGSRYQQYARIWLSNMSSSVLIKQIADIHKMLGSSFFCRWTPQTFGTQWRVVKAK